MPSNDLVSTQEIDRYSFFTLFEIARVLARFDRVASIIVNTDHSAM
jgi:hypothetical protein